MDTSTVALWYTVALLVPFLGTLALTPVATRMAHRFDILDHPKDHKFHGHVTPYLGGIAVAGGLLVIGVVAATVSVELLAILVGALAMMIVGFEDDRRDVGPWLKLIVEVAAGVLLWSAGVRVTFFDVIPVDIIFTVIWVIAITNAVNLLDNMDGLASGAAAIASFTFFIIAAVRGDFAVAGLSLAVAGSSLGFLRRNFPPARIFLGDAGSLLLGFMLAALALKLDLIGQVGIIRAAVPILILGVPIFDTLLVIIARIAEGRPVTQGGTDHSSHRLTHAGLSGRGVALLVYAIQFLLSAIALLVMVTSTPVAIGAIISVALVALFLMVRLLKMGHQRVGDAPAAAAPETS